jgi:CTP synthase (UTP-ammonia lyase)
VPHITDAIQEWVERVALQPVKGNIKPEVCIIELGGTIGDIEGMPFVEAFRQFQFRVKVCVKIFLYLNFSLSKKCHFTISEKTFVLDMYL